MDKVFIDKLTVMGILGIYPHEQVTPQKILVSMVASTDIKPAAQSDHIDQAVNYASLAEDITNFIQSKPHHTIETLIETLAEQILQDDKIISVWLRVEKPEAVPAAESVGVEIIRSR